MKEGYREIVVAMDSFKGSLTSQQASETLAEGIRAQYPDCRVVTIPLADGGEGSAEVLTEALGGSFVEVEVSAPRGGRLMTRYGLVEGVAIMDFASAAGLTLLTPEQRNPLLTTSHGVGEMMADALRRGCRKILLGLGGSATNDCATGALQALGVRFFDASGEEVGGCGGNLARIASIDTSYILPQLADVELVLLTDVTTPLCGTHGATRTFAPQKGATAEMVARLEEGVDSFARVMEEFAHRSVADLAGGGAAGGAAAAFVALAHAEIRHGADVVLEAVDFRHRVRGSELVITGEGRIDHQTLLGKLPSRVAAVARQEGVPTIGVGGSIELCPHLVQSDLFVALYASTPEDMPLAEALQPTVAQRNLQQLGKRLKIES